MGVGSETQQQQVDVRQGAVGTLGSGSGRELLAVVGGRGVGGGDLVRAGHRVHPVPRELQGGVPRVCRLHAVALRVRSGQEALVRPPHVDPRPVDQRCVLVVGDLSDHPCSHAPAGEHDRGLTTLVLGRLEHLERPPGRLRGEQFLVRVGHEPGFGPSAHAVPPSAASVDSSTASADSPVSSATSMALPSVTAVPGSSAERVVMRALPSPRVITSP